MLHSVGDVVPMSDFLSYHDPHLGWSGPRVWFLLLLLILISIWWFWEVIPPPPGNIGFLTKNVVWINPFSASLVEKITKKLNDLNRAKIGHLGPLGPLLGPPPWTPRGLYVLSLSYREFRVKLGNCRWLFETENMDRFLIKWYFYYRKGVKFYMVPQKSRKKSRQALKISVKVRFPILKLPFVLSFIYCTIYNFTTFQ